MTREQQDKLWNELSEEHQKTLRYEYQDFIDIIELRDGTPEEIAKAYGQKQTLWALFGEHNLNPKPLTYFDIEKEVCDINGKNYQKWSEKEIAIHRLLVVAKYLNGDWKPNWDKAGFKWYLSIKEDVITIFHVLYENSSIVYFRTEKLAQQAIQILGEETIRLALSCDF